MTFEHRRLSIPVIWNESAGEKRHGALPKPGREQIEQALTKAGVDARIIATATVDDAKSAIASELDGGADLIVAAGGDGTADVVGKALIGKPAALGLLPMGSVMNVARMLGVPRDLDGAAAVLAERREDVIDLGEANGEIFFEDASVGITAAVFNHAAEWEKGELRSLVRAARAAFRYRPRHMDLTLDDGRKIATRALMVIVSNAPYAALGMTVAPDARLNDGQFDVVVWKHFSKFELFRHLAAISFGRRRYTPHSETYRTASIKIAARSALPVQGRRSRAGRNAIGVPRQAAGTARDRGPNVRERPRPRRARVVRRLSRKGREAKVQRQRKSRGRLAPAAALKCRERKFWVSS